MTTRYGTSARKGRGALSNAVGRFERVTREDFDDGWGDGPEDGPRDGPEGGRDHDDVPPPKLRTTLIRDTTRKIIAWNDSPDLPFDRSINP